MSTGPHPFPPVVRWAVFPPLAMAAGAGGGVLASTLAGEAPLQWAAIAGGTSLGAALAAVLSRRAWIALLVGPVAGLLTLCGVVALAMGRGRTALDLLRHLLQERDALLTMSAGVWLQAAASYLALRPPLPPPWPRLLALHGAAGLLSGAVAYLCVPDRVRGSVALLFVLSTAAQAIVVRISLSLAAGFRKDGP